MPKVVFALILILASGASGAASSLSKSCFTKEPVLISPMPPPREQGALALCTSFSVATVLDHYLCKKKLEDCSSGKSITSVLDIVNKGTKRGIVQLADVSSIMRNLSNQTISKEECAPFSNFKGTEFLKSRNKYLNSKGEEIPITERNSDLSVFANLTSIWKDLFSEKGTKDPDCNCTVNTFNRVNELTKLKISLFQVQGALEKSTESEFIAALAIPSECKDTAIKLPELKPTVFAVSSNPILSKIQSTKIVMALNLQQKLRPILKSNRPIIWGFETGNASAGHNVIILGYREQCCEERNGKDRLSVCSTEYLVRDPQYEDGKKMDSWVSETLVINKALEVFEKKECLTDEGARCNFAFTYLPE